MDDVSEGGTYSVRSGRSGDIDEGFGVSMMSADITTATWGGSTQPSSTQNDSAVSADGSDDENQGGEVRFHKYMNDREANVPLLKQLPLYVLTSDEQIFLPSLVLKL